MGNNQSIPNDFKPEQPPFNGRCEKDVLLPPSSIQIEISGKNFFSIVLDEPKKGIYVVNLLYRDSNDTMTQFYQFEMMQLLKNNVKVDISGSIIKFSFEIYPIDGESQVFSYAFFFSDSGESKFELGNPLKSLPVLLPLNEELIHICFNFFYYINPIPKTQDDEIDIYEIYIVQSSGSSSDGICKRHFGQTDKVIQKITWDSGFPSIRRDSATGHFFVASVSDDPKKPVCINELRQSNHLINLPDPIELLETGKLVLSQLSIPFASGPDVSILYRMSHLINGMYLFQRPVHPTIQEICIVKSSAPDYWRPQRTRKFFSYGDVIVEKIYLRTPNPLDILSDPFCESSFILGTDGTDDFTGYLLKLEN